MMGHEEAFDQVDDMQKLESIFKKLVSKSKLSKKQIV
jgi:hypothetical protein